MERKEVLGLSNEQLYDEFVEDVISNWFKSKELVSQLEETERFREDVVFNIHVQTARQFILICQQKSDEVLEKAEELIERAHTLKLPKILTLNYHIMGIAYNYSDFYEKSLESFMNVLKYSRIHQLNNLTSMVYFYISVLYALHNASDEALEYMNLAFKVLEETKDSEPRYQTKLIMFSSSMVYLLYEAKKYDEIQAYMDVMWENLKTDSSPQGIYTYKRELLHYYGMKKEFEKMRNTFYELLELIEKDSEFRYELLVLYASIMIAQGAEPSFYEEELQLYHTWGESGKTYLNFLLNNYLYRCYELKNDKIRTFSFLKQALHHIKQEMSELKATKVNSFKIIRRNVSMEENISGVEEKNYELKLMADEANRNKILAESTLHRLKVVSELGKKLTYSLDVQDIIKTVYSRLVKSIALSNFIIVIKNDELNQLESIVNYIDGKPMSSLVIDFEDKDSVFVESFKSNTFIQINDFYEDVKFEHQKSIASSSLYRSVLFLPLSIENEVLGVCSIQHPEPNVYKPEDIEALEQLMPFLAIALNNAFKSQALEREVNHHRKTKNELEKANHKLEVLSYLDGLTQISNRRDFEKRILEYLKKSRELGLSLSLFMFDIDYFKFFNDTYGHLEGDRALKIVAGIIQKCFSEVGGISARFGGEEFVAACLGLDEKESMDLAEKIRKEVFSKGIVNEKSPLKNLSISIGIAYCGGFEKLKKFFVMRWADLSLYQAKREGRNKAILKAVHVEEEPPEGLE